MSLNVDVPILKPPTAGKKRVFLGISWERSSSTLSSARSAPSTPNPDKINTHSLATIEKTFEGFPAAGHLFPGDKILEVNGDPINTPEDVAFSWEKAGDNGEVIIRVARQATLCVKLQSSSSVKPSITWMSEVVPLVKALTYVQTSGELAAPGQESTDPALKPQDLIVSVNGMAISKPAEANAALEKAFSAGIEVEVGLQRGALNLMVDSSDCWDEVCCTCWSGRTRVPLARTPSKKKIDASPLLQIT